MVDDGEDGLLTAALRALCGDDSGRMPYEADLRDRALHVLPALSACRKIVDTTKVDWLLSVLGWGEAPPDDVAVLWRSAPVGKAHVASIRAVVEAFGAPLVFVGDLDPLDLATFSTLARALRGVPSEVRFAGVGDRWIELCERHLAPDRALRSLGVAMTGPERSALRQAEDAGLGWDALAGPRGMALLESGVKLELEGATSPTLYSPILAGELARSILD